MAKLRFTIREVLTWTTWLALYLGLRRTLFVDNGRFEIGRIWIEAHVGVVWSAVAIDQFFRPEVRRIRRYLRGAAIGALAGVIFAVETIFGLLPGFALVTVFELVASAVFGLLAVLFYSFLALRRSPRPSLDPPPAAPTTLPDNRSSHDDRAPP